MFVNKVVKFGVHSSYYVVFWSGILLEIELEHRIFNIFVEIPCKDYQNSLEVIPCYNLKMVFNACSLNFLDQYIIIKFNFGCIEC